MDEYETWILQQVAQIAIREAAVKDRGGDFMQTGLDLQRLSLQKEAFAACFAKYRELKDEEG